MKKLLRQLFRFLSHGIWTVDDQKLNRVNRYLVKLARIIIIAFEDFGEKKLILQASALTFYTLLSIVPVAAMLFGVAKGFGLEERLRQELFRSFAEQPQLLEYLLGFVNRLLSNTQGGIMAIFGLILLIWSVLQVLSSVESSFNSIWQVTGSRSFVRKFTDYFSIVLIAPILIIVTGSATIFISGFITGFAEEWITTGYLKQLVIFSINLIPFVSSSLVFTLLYLIMPNTRVKFSSALVAGIVAGCSFQLFQWAYVEFQVGVSRLNAIYGSFAFFPLFITFLQISWILVLVGAEISYSLQNIGLHMDERRQFTPSNKEKLALFLTIMALVARRFAEGNKPHSAEELSERLDLPYKAVREYCNELCRAGLLSEVVQDRKDTDHAFQPAVDLDKLDVAYIISQVENFRPEGKQLKLPDELIASQLLVDRIYHNTAGSAENIHISELYPGSAD